MEAKFPVTCRCCLSVTGTMKDLFEVDTQKLTKMYTKCSGVGPESLLDETWRNICELCEDKLVTSYEFRELCQTSSVILLQRCELKQEQVSEDEDMERIIYAEVDYTVAARKPEDLTHSFNQVFLATTDLEPAVIKREEQKDGNEFDNERTSDVEIEQQKYKKTEKLDDEQFDIINIMPGKFICFICDEVLPSYREYQTHRLLHNEVRRIDKKCPICKEDIKGYMKHIDDKHKDYRPFECGTCKAVYQSLHPLRMHLFTHSKKLMFKCMAHKCGQKFLKPDLLRQHIATTRHSRNLYHCQNCGLGFVKFLLLHDHFKQQHDEQNVKKILPCFYCKKTFVHRKTMLEHKCEPSKKRKTIGKEISTCSLTCERCQAQFKDDDELVCHEHSLCIEEPKFICPTCGKEFASAYRLNSHKSIHDNRKFVCDVCGTVFMSKSGLDGHKLAHTVGRAYKCDLCPASFVEKSGLKIHRIIHEKKRYMCDLCGKRFRTYHYIKQHIFSIHQKGVHKFACEVCGKTFVRRCDYSSHIRNSHQSDDPVKCNLCDKVFATKRLLKRHSATHATSYYECKQCGKKFTKPFGLKNHTFLHRGFSPYNCNYCPRKFIKKYMFSKHLQSHNAKFDEKVHGYQELEINWRQLLADSFRTPHTQDGRDFSMATEVFD